MVMEFERGNLASTRWTSNSPRTFARAPGAGMGAAPVEFTAEPMLVLAKKWKIDVTQEDRVGVKDPVPAMIMQLRFTDRGSIALGSQLDAQILTALKKAGFLVSKTSNFVPLPVTWGRKTIGGDLYVPYVTSPASLAGLVYSGNAVTLPWTAAQATDPAESAKLPSSLYTYTFSVTGDDFKMTDMQGAKALSVVHSWLQGQTFGAYMTGKAVLTTMSKSVFDAPIPVVQASAIGLILVAAWNMVSPHIKKG